jgi:secreted trypsin-like serine protease
VVGGSPADPADYPSTVAVTDTQGEPFCTGTLVAPKAVVTAAHCIHYISTSKMRVVYGYADPAQAPAAERRPVALAKAHPDYDSNAPPLTADGLAKSNDIGVLVLGDPVAGGVVTPILPASLVDVELTPSREVHVVGYGIYDMSSWPWKGGVLYKAITPHVSHIQWEMLAGRPGEPDTCNGDSGGPGYILSGGTLWLVGVTSRAYPYGAICGDGGIYTMAPAYVAWIESVAGPIGPGGDGGVSEAGSDGPLDADVGPKPDTAADAHDAKEAASSCVPTGAVCDPLTNVGCNGASGEVCEIESVKIACAKGPHTAQPGAMCDQTSLLCVAGYHCGLSITCEKLCCVAEGCAGGAPCVKIQGGPGTIGTCGPIEPDAAADAVVDAVADAAAEAREGAAGSAGGAADAAGDTDGRAGSAGQPDAAAAGDAGSSGVAGSSGAAAPDDTTLGGGACACAGVGRSGTGFFAQEWGAVGLLALLAARRRRRRAPRAAGSRWTWARGGAQDRTHRG